MIKYTLTEQAKQLINESKALSFEPRRMTDGSNGYDLAACIPRTIYLRSDEVVKIPLGVCISLDNQPLADHSTSTKGNFKFAGLLMPRSSNPGFQLTNTIGLLDSDFVHGLFAKVVNRGTEMITIDPGERIVQLVIFMTYCGEIFKVEELVATGRTGGDGSTGR